MTELDFIAERLLAIQTEQGQHTRRRHCDAGRDE